jgi:hypothetical protein
MLQHNMRFDKIGSCEQTSLVAKTHPRLENLAITL